MEVVEGSPRAEVRAEVAPLECAPDAFAVRHAAHVALTPVGVVLRIGVGTELQLADHVLHAPPALLVAHGGIHGHRRQVVTAHMSVQPVPVGVGLGLWLQPRLLAVGSQQAVAVVLEKCLDVQVAGGLQRAVKQGHVAERKLVGIEPVLCARRQHSRGEDEQRNDFFHKRFYLNLFLGDKYMK